MILVTGCWFAGDSTGTRTLVGDMGVHEEGSGIVEPCAAAATRWVSFWLVVMLTHHGGYACSW